MDWSLENYSPSDFYSGQDAFDIINARFEEDGRFPLTHIFSNSEIHRFIEEWDYMILGTITQEQVREYIQPEEPYHYYIEEYPEITFSDLTNYILEIPELLYTDLRNFIEVRI